MRTATRSARLRWMCRRGMKELDVLLEAFLEDHGAALEAGGWPQFEEFLQEEDDRLWAWIQGQVRPPEERYQELLEALHGRA
ncbi:MAG: hypothetical protein GWM87_01595 [Xanthomonadales bacterium]|nr:hypothetical protein [Xanthomonadales bacterium]NIX11776.1 hypothetical protein [Xanthomonadales bacterium]